MDARPSSAVLAAMLARSKKDYPFLNSVDPVVVPARGQGQEGWSETWFKGDPGGDDYHRPEDIPMDRTGIEVYNPDFSEMDLVGEGLHADPRANAARDALRSKLDTRQLNTLANEALDFNSSLHRGQSGSDAIRNSVDSAMRGYTLGQWPDSANVKMRYSPEQQQILDGLKQYMKRGY